MTSKRVLKGLLLPALLISILTLASLTCRPAPSGKADLIITGKIFTGRNSQPFVEALAVGGDKILAIGSREEINRYAEPETRIIELAGGVAIPGLIDAHTHFSSGGQSLIELSFRGVDSVEKVQQMIAARIKELPPGTPILVATTITPCFQARNGLIGQSSIKSLLTIRSSSVASMGIQPGLTPWPLSYPALIAAHQTPLEEKSSEIRPAASQLAF